MSSCDLYEKKESCRTKAVIFLRNSNKLHSKVHNIMHKPLLLVIIRSMPVDFAGFQILAL